MVTYNEKHNIRNGEDNRDGSNDNQSWNCGVEGESDDPKINALRLRQQKNIAFLLILSDGVPMIMAGDEFGRTQKGTNNAYCQDNDISWVDWSLLEKNSGLYRFFRLLIKHKKNYALSKYHDFILDDANSPDSEVHFHGVRAYQPDWSETSRTLGVQVRSEKKLANHKTQKVDLYTFSNAHWETHKVELPTLIEGAKWYVIMDTSKVSPEDFLEEPRLLEDQNYYVVKDRSTIMLEGK
jgi:glycogen operon protein